MVVASNQHAAFGPLFPLPVLFSVSIRHSLKSGRFPVEVARVSLLGFGFNWFLALVLGLFQRRCASILRSRAAGSLRATVVSTSHQRYRWDHCTSIQIYCRRTVSYSVVFRTRVGVRAVVVTAVVVFIFKIHPDLHPALLHLMRLPSVVTG